MTMQNLVLSSLIMQIEHEFMMKNKYEMKNKFKEIVIIHFKNKYCPT